LLQQVIEQNLLIIISSYAIVAFFTRGFIDSTNTGPAPPGSASFGNGGLGAGIVQSVYPTPNSFGIPRNTNIFVTFKEPIKPSTIMNGTQLNTDGVRIINVSDGETALTGSEVDVQTNANNTIFTFNPQDLLGSETEPQEYRVELRNTILKAATDDLAFPNAIGDIGFQWRFSVSTFIA